MTYDARQVANFFLDLADERGTPLTIMSLLKLLYYAHGWYLAEHNQPLINNRFEAWENGPVVRVVYRQFRDNGAMPIQNRAFFFDPVNRQKETAQHDFSNEVTSFLAAIFEEYAQHHAFTLSDMTHESGGPWDKAWNDKSGTVNPGMVISNEDIKQYFRRRASSSPAH